MSKYSVIATIIEVLTSKIIITITIKTIKIIKLPQEKK